MPGLTSLTPAPAPTNLLQSSLNSVQIPYPDGSTATSPFPNNNAFSAVSLFDSSTLANSFPIVTLSYVIVPTSTQLYTTAYNAESAGFLLAFLQFVYSPEARSGGVARV